MASESVDSKIVESKIADVQAPSMAKSDKPKAYLHLLFFNSQHKNQKITQMLSRFYWVP